MSRQIAELPRLRYNSLFSIAAHLSCLVSDFPLLIDMVRRFDRSVIISYIRCTNQFKCASTFYFTGVLSSHKPETIFATVCAGLRERAGKGETVDAFIKYGNLLNGL